MSYRSGQSVVKDPAGSTGNCLLQSFEGTARQVNGGKAADNKMAIQAECGSFMGMSAIHD